MSDKELKEATIEFVNYALASCPYCDSEIEVSTCDSGNETCVICGNEYHWATGS